MGMFFHHPILVLVIAAHTSLEYNRKERQACLCLFSKVNTYFTLSTSDWPTQQSAFVSDHRGCARLSGDAAISHAHQR